jgi:hypothetical protein
MTEPSTNPHSLPRTCPVAAILGVHSAGKPGHSCPSWRDHQELPPGQQGLLRARAVGRLLDVHKGGVALRALHSSRDSLIKFIAHVCSGDLVLSLDRGATALEAMMLLS